MKHAKLAVAVVAMVSAACGGAAATRPPPVAHPPTAELSRELPPPMDEVVPESCEQIQRAARVDAQAPWVKSMDRLLAELSTTSFPEAPDLHAACLCVLANAFGEGSEEWQQMRTQAGLIAGAPDTSLRQAKRLKEGLEAALALVERRSSQLGAADPRSLRVARAAVARIDAGTPISFQRAATHDALRTLTTALLRIEREGTAPPTG